MNMKRNKLSSPTVMKNTVALDKQNSESNLNTTTNTSITPSITTGKLPSCFTNPFRSSSSSTSSSRDIIASSNTPAATRSSIKHKGNNSNNFKTHSNGVTNTATITSTTGLVIPHMMRVGQEEEILRKNRKVIDHYLRRLGALMGKKDMSLNVVDGMGYFSHGKFVVLIEVPIDHFTHVFIYTMVCRFENQSVDNILLVLQKAMRYNYLGSGTRGSTLGWDGQEEINLSYTTPIASLTFSNFQTIVEGFLLTAVEVNEKLDAAKKQQQQHHPTPKTP